MATVCRLLPVALVLVAVAGCGVGSGDADGQVSTFSGAVHCGWESVEVIRVSSELAPPIVEDDPWVTFVRDTEGVLPDRLTLGAYETDASLPEGATDTGVETPFGELWVGPSASDGAHLVSGGRVSRWPAGYPGCD